MVPLIWSSLKAVPTATIYTSSGGWAALRGIAIPAHSWVNWLYPIPF